MNKLLLALKKAGINGFFLGLILMIILAKLFPFYGSEASPLMLHTITDYGVAVIFFFYGLRLSPENLSIGLSNWKLHLLIQATTFILFPLMVLIFYWAFGTHEHHYLWLGTFYLAALPSTVSSSVVMVSIARGNLPGAIFNASISSIIGIFVTPIWIGFFLEQTDAAIDLGPVILQLCLQILLPVVSGLLLHKKFGYFVERNKNSLRLFDQLVILLIVYTAFAESFLGDMFSNHSNIELLVLSLFMLAFFFIMFGLMHVLSTMLRFNREDRITTLFCGSKKSLVQGAVMGKVLFPDPVVLGVILLPIMIYHALQLLAGGAIAEKMSKQPTD